MGPNVRLAILVVLVAGAVALVYFLLRPEAVAPVVEPVASISDEAAEEDGPEPGEAWHTEEPDAGRSLAPTGGREGRERRSSGRGRVEGFVTEESGTAVAGASIRIERIDWEANELPGAEPFVQTAVSDDEGGFLFERLPLGRYALVASRESRSAVEYGELTREEYTRSIRLILREAGAVSGTVRDAAGAPVAGAVVYPHHRESERPADHLRAAALRGETDDDGAFSLADIPVGEWKLCARAEGYAPLITDFLPVPGSGYELTLGTGGSVSGRVVDAGTGAPVSDIEVVLTSEEGERDRHEAVTDDEGRFAVARVRPDEYTLGIDDEFRVLTGDAPKTNVVEGEEVSDVELRVVEGGVIAGRVYDADTGAGVADVDLTAFTEGDGPNRSEIRTDASGRYRITGLGDARYYVMPQRTPGYGSPGWFEQKQVAAKPGQTVDGVDFALSRGVRIAGRVVDNSGRPVEGARVEGITDMGQQRRTAVSGGNGAFEVAGLRATTSLQVMARKAGFASGRLGPMELPDAGLEDLVLTLEPEGIVTGSVVDAQGRPVAAARVAATPSAPFFFDMPSTEADGQGRFEVRGLNTGRYRLSATRRGVQTYGDPEGQEVDVTAGQRIDGVTLVIDDSGLAIEGRLTDAQGRPVEGAYVSAMGMQRGGSATSDASGQYRVAGLAEATYGVSVHHRKYSSAHLPNVAAGSRGIDFVLKGRGIIEGRVLDDATGKPVTEFEIAALPGPIGGSFNPWMERSVTRMHHPQGFFRLEDVDAGPATVHVRANGYAPNSTAVSNVPADGTVSDVVVRLSSGAAIEGVVIDSMGQPVAGAQVFLGPVPMAPMREQGASARSAADGTFRLDSVAEGPTVVSAHHPKYAQGSVDVSPVAGAVQHVEIVLSLGGVIEGTVTLGKVPMPNQSISMHSVQGQGGMPQGIQTAQTDADGAYRLMGVLPGDVMVNAHLNLGEGGVMNQRSQSRPARVEEGQVTVVDFHFDEADAAIEGYVTRNGVATSAHVNALAAASEAGGGPPSEQHMAQADAQGFYRIDNIPSGTYRLMVAAFSPESPGVQRSVTVVAESGKVTRCDVELSGGARVVGTVEGMETGETGHVMAVAGSATLPDSPTIESFQHLSMSTVAGAALGPDGTFRIEGLEPGEYTVMAVVMPEAAGVTDLNDLFSLMRIASEEVTVDESGEVSVQLSLP